MTVEELIVKLSKFRNRKVDVVISDEQGRYVLANHPYKSDRKLEMYGEEVFPRGTVIISYENT